MNNNHYSYMEGNHNNRIHNSMKYYVFVLLSARSRRVDDKSAKGAINLSLEKKMSHFGK